MLAGVIDHFGSKIEEHDGHRHISNEGREPRSNNFAEYSAEDGHDGEGAISSQENDNLVVSHGHDHAQEKGFIPNFAD